MNFSLPDELWRCCECKKEFFEDSPTVCPECKSREIQYVEDLPSGGGHGPF